MADPKAKPATQRKAGRPRYDQGISAEDTKKRLLEVAISLFSQHGYEAVSTGDVARQANLTQSMVHYHFSSKELLWKAAVHGMMRGRGRMFPPPASTLAGLDPVARLRLLIRTLITANAANPALIKVAVHESSIASPRLQWLVETYVGSGYKLFDDAFRAAIAEGSIPDVPVMDLTNMVTAISLLFGMQAMVSQIYGLDLSDEAAVESFCDTVLHVLFKGMLTTK